ncbi:MAG: nucleotidyl transferase AbiEii/AbiGii toxin family protein [Polyangiaceae bacterium]|nr:nucleotidyl transferase AbiEii/AbiGii toxin family protein [Polyangiaceae bacterium]MBK8942304.1 nucleotidyl transferase AbiEii/AbiGii toxin family protein [Polyangiaceae bacterium]
MKSRLAATLEQIAADLDDLAVRWALVGGLAVSSHVEPRTTRDVDIAVDLSSDREAERLVFELTRRGYSVAATVEQKRLGRLATVRLRPPGGGRAIPVVDLLFSSSSIEPETVASADRIEVLSGVVVPVARLPHLIAMKVLARDDRHRPQDWDDLKALTTASSNADLDEARALLRLIEARGAQRGRDLLQGLESVLDED